MRRPVARSSRKHSRKKPEVSCEACAGPIPGQRQPRKFCLACVPAGSPAEVAAAWRRLNPKRIEALQAGGWECEREERCRRGDEARRILVEALHAQHQRGKAA
jgi:hypothetical protein